MPIRNTIRRAVWSLLALSLSLGVSTTARAQDTNEPVTLQGNAMIRAERMQMLREEFRERQMEIREAIERVRRGPRARGKKVQPTLRDSDYAGQTPGRSVSPFGTRQSSVAPTNTKANDKTADGAGAGQAEQHIAFLGQNGLCAWNDGQGFTTGPDVQGYGFTTNGGATWIDGGAPLKQGTITSWSSDPAIAVNEKTGDFYYCGLTTNSGTNNNGVGVARGHFQAGTFVWDAATMVIAGPSASQAFDKQWIAADSLTGNLYVTWTRFVVGGSHLFAARSTDNGATWSTPVQITGSWENGLASGSRPAVGPNGEVYATYAAIGPIDADSVKVAKSTNFGVSYSPSVVSMVEFDNYFTGAPGFNRGRAVTFPSIAVDRSTGPNRGRVYTAIQDCVNFYPDPLGGGTSKSEVENNGNFLNATPFTINQTLRGAIATSDIDNWKFSAVQGQTYVFFVDSVRTTTFKYTMRLYCPNDTVAVSRLAMSSDGSGSSATNVHALIVWTAPTTNTYYLRMQFSTSTGGYRIRTGVHVPNASDVARDARDVMVASSANGQTGWTARTRINDDLPLYDNWLPEVATGCDGNVYAMWFDWRDTPASCFGGSNIYVSRSTNGGAAWTANQVATTATTANWSQVASNIAPNQGDYNGMSGGDWIGMAWADGRLGDSDVFTARVATTHDLTGCPTNQVVLAGTTFNGSATVNNANGMFGNSYQYAISADQPWANGASGNVSASESSSGSIPISITVPAVTPDGTVAHVCVTVSQNGACVRQCCFDLTVSNPATSTLASLASISAGPGGVEARWLVAPHTSVQVYRTTDGSSWMSLGSRLSDGEGFVTVTDADVAAGVRYGYRLGLSSGSGESFAGLGWIEVPLSAEFAVHGAFPNPAVSGFSLSFSLARSGPAMVEMFDLGGRRVMAEDLGTLEAGRHTVSLERRTAQLPVGVYSVRLSQGGQVARTKVTVSH